MYLHISVINQLSRKNYQAFDSKTGITDRTRTQTRCREADQTKRKHDVYIQACKAIPLMIDR